MEFAARIEGGLVAEIVQLPEGVPLVEAFHPDAGFVSATAEAQVGMRYEEGAFLPAPNPAPIVLPVPTAISDRQFAQQLAILGVITETEALAWASRGELPAALEAALADLPEGERFGARMLLAAATTYERQHPLVAQLGTALDYDEPALDALWRAAAQL